VNEVSVFETVQLALLVSGSVAVIAGAIIAAWRLIPHRTTAAVPLDRLQTLEDAVEAVRLVQIDFADKWETTVRRNNTRVGRLRRKLAHERGEDEDEDDEVDDAPQLPMPGPVADPHPRGADKVELWAAFNQQRGAA